MKTEYNIKENGFNEIRKQLIVRMVGIGLPAIFIGVGISYWNSDDQSDVNVLLFLIPIILLAGGFGVRTAIKRQKQIFNSFHLVLDDEKLYRYQDMIPDVEIALNDIKTIVKTKHGGLLIKGEGNHKMIIVPAQLNQIDGLELELSKLIEIKPATNKSLNLLLILGLSVLSIGLMLIVYLASHKVLVGISGLVLTCGLVYLLVTIQMNKNIDVKTKRSMWVLLIVVFSIVMVTYHKVFGGGEFI